MVEFKTDPQLLEMLGFWPAHPSGQDKEAPKAAAVSPACSLVFTNAVALLLRADHTGPGQMPLGLQPSFQNILFRVFFFLIKAYCFIKC